MSLNDRTLYHPQMIVIPSHPLTQKPSIRTKSISLSPLLSPISFLIPTQPDIPAFSSPPTYSRSISHSLVLAAFFPPISHPPMPINPAQIYTDFILLSILLFFLELNTRRGNVRYRIASFSFLLGFVYLFIDRASDSTEYVW